ncbi:MAG: methyltransferase domain-containing protein [Candidatus Dormibacteraeota bacterium]|nr:methyltransferase domain-containing protein [Candidatus Dormibacteraeota bacterium]
MGLRARILGGMAAQLGRPTGFRGRLVGIMLNRANRSATAAAIDALALQQGAVAADVGFGGGVGLALLLKRVGPEGRVHGVDLSPTMVSRARRRFKREIASSRLQVHSGSITQLPLDDRSIQGVITINTIYFVGELDRAFSELARVITSSGRVVVGIRDPEVMAHVPLTAFGFRLRPVHEVIGVAKSSGLALQELRVDGHGDGAMQLLVFTRAL